MLELQDASRRPSQESLTGVDTSHLHPGQIYQNGHRRSPSLRSPSPRRHGHHYAHHDIGFSDTVSNVVEMVKEAHHPRYGYGHPRYSRGGHHVQHSYPTLASRRAGAGRRLPPTPSKPSTLDLKSSSIKINGSPTHHNHHGYRQHHGTLRDVRDKFYSSSERDRDRERYRDHLRDYDLRYEYRDRERELFERERERERDLERERMEYIAPLSFEQALAMGRTGRVLPSPVLNGFKPKGVHTRHSDSDEEDWC